MSMIDPIALQALMSGLTPLSIQQGFETQQDQELASLSRQVQQAQQAAGGAQQAYQQQAAAPPPQAQGHLDQLAGNVGSVLSGDPSHGQRAHQRTQGAQSDLMEARKNNLLSLQQVYAQKADAAERLGNLEMAEKARTSHERVARALKQMDDEDRFQRAAGEAQKDRDFKASEGKLDRESAERIAGMRADGKGEHTTDPSAIPALAETVLSGQAKITDFLGRDRDDIVSYIRSTGKKILPPKVRDTLNTLKGAKTIVSTLERLSKTLNTARAGPGGITRVVSGAVKKAGAMTQTNPQAALYHSAREGFLATLARAAGERGTLTDQDIARARSMMPSLLDSKDVAVGKIAQLRAFVSELEQGAVDAYTNVQSSQLPAGAGPDAGEGVQVDLVWNPATGQLEAP